MAWRWGLPLLAIGLSVLGLWWSARTTPLAPVVTEESTALPQLRMQGIERVTVKADGTWVSTLTASAAEYYSANDELWLTQPIVRAAGTPPNHLTADTARVQQGQHWLLAGNVVVTNDPDHPTPLVIRTEQLQYDTASQLATTEQAVNIRQGERMNTDAIGMTLNLETMEFDLHEHVRSTFRPDQ